MGFLQNLLSLRSRRSKKHRTRMEVDTYGTPPILDLRQQHDDQEATVNRLLRSSSARFAIMREVDYASLPPLPHPIHNVLPTPTVSTSSLPIVSQRGTYTVRILSRTLHSRTEFPNANPDESITPNRLPHDSSRRRSKSVPITPRDKTRLLGLRQDPSVASLLNLYDEHGCLNSKVFSNSPTSPDTGPDNEGRSQLRRGGSTLRQLLGGPSSLSARHARGTSAAEGDISWAERYLCESANSSTSSLGVPTPNGTPLPHDHFTDAHNDNTLLHDTATNNSDLYPGISSLEVELSMIAEDRSSPKNLNSRSPYQNHSPMTPQRASQVFAFLTEKKSQSRRQSQFDSEEGFPVALPDPLQPPASRFSSYSSSAGSHESDIPLSYDTHTNHDVKPRSHKTESTIRFGYNQASSQWPSEFNWLEPPHNRTRNQRTSTASSCNLMHQGPSVQQTTITLSSEAQSSHNLGSPRSLPPIPYNLAKPTSLSHQQQPPRKLSSSPHETRRSEEQTHNSNIATASSPNFPISNDLDVFTAIPSRLSHRHTPSRSTIAITHVSGNQEKPVPYVMPAAMKPKELKERYPVHDKENESEGVVFHKAQYLPKTPIRPRSAFRAPVDSTPSPASSSDLSPVAQQLMADLRTQRMHARERAKRNGRWSSTTSRLKW